MSKAVELSPQMQNYLNTAKKLEGGIPTGTTEEVEEFVEFVEGNWSAILDDFQMIAPDARRQGVILWACEFLPPAEYTSFLSTILNKYEANALSKEVVVAALEPEGKKRGFLEFNYQHPGIRSFCERIIMIYQNDANLQQRMTRILSGEAGKDMALALFNENLPEPEKLE